MYLGVFTYIVCIHTCVVSPTEVGRVLVNSDVTARAAICENFTFRRCHTEWCMVVRVFGSRLVLFFMGP